MQYKLSERDFFIVTTAAWFHDIGYLKGAEKHEEKGAKMATTFLKDAGIDYKVLVRAGNVKPQMQWFIFAFTEGHRVWPYYPYQRILQTR